MWTDPGWFIYQLGGLDLILIVGCMTLYLSFSTLYSSSLWRTDTIIVSKLNMPPLSNRLPVSIKSPPPPQMGLNKPSGGLIEDFRYVYMVEGEGGELS